MFAWGLRAPAGRDQPKAFLHKNSMRTLNGMEPPMDGRRGARIDSFTAPQNGTRVYIYTCTDAMRGSSTVSAGAGLQELQQQCGEEDGTTAVRESSHQVRPCRSSPARRRAAVRGRRCRCGRRRVGPCGERSSCQCRHFCQDSRGVDQMVFVTGTYSSIILLCTHTYCKISRCTTTTTNVVFIS